MKWLWVVVIVILYMTISTYIDRVHLMRSISDVEIVRGGVER